MRTPIPAFQFLGLSYTQFFPIYHWVWVFLYLTFTGVGPLFDATRATLENEPLLSPAGAPTVIYLVSSKLTGEGHFSTALTCSFYSTFSFSCRRMSS